MGFTEALLQSGIEVISTTDAMADREDLKIARNNGTERRKPTLAISQSTRDMAVRRGIIPQAYKDSVFSLETVIANQRKQRNKSARKFKIINFEEYEEVLNGITATLIANRLPSKSYLIGAPNGFGKTSFVNSCIAMLYEQGRLCVPYISLTELAQVRLAEQERLARGLTSNNYYYGNVTSRQEYEDKIRNELAEIAYEKKPINIISKFSWSEFMEADLLFCYFTNVECKVVESEAFKTVLNIRGAKGLPTIAMISSSLNPYKRDANLSEFVWNEILEYKDENSYDRVQHVSCWKDYNAPLISKDGSSDRD